MSRVLNIIINIDININISININEINEIICSDETCFFFLENEVIFRNRSQDKKEKSKSHHCI